MSTACVVWLTRARTAPSCPLGARLACLMDFPRPGTSDYGEKDGGSAVPGLLNCPHRTRRPLTHSCAGPQRVKEGSIQCVHECVQARAYDRTVFGAERTRVGDSQAYLYLPGFIQLQAWACLQRKTVPPPDYPPTHCMLHIYQSSVPWAGSHCQARWPHTCLPGGVISQPVVQVHTPPGGFLSSTGAPSKVITTEASDHSFPWVFSYINALHKKERRVSERLRNLPKVAQPVRTRA